jgi:hypothetical protein
MTDNSKVKLIKKLDVTDLDGEKVMIDFSSGKYFLLKGSANDIWDYIQNPVSVSEIVDKLMSVYDVPEDICRESTFSFLSQLKNYAFVTIE